MTAMNLEELMIECVKETDQIGFKALDPMIGFCHHQSRWAAFIVSDHLEHPSATNLFLLTFPRDEFNNKLLITGAGNTAKEAVLDLYNKLLAHKKKLDEQG